MSACISLDGTRIAAVFADKTLCAYDTTTGEVILPPFKVDEIPGAVILSRDGNLVALGGQALRLWNVETGKMVQSFGIEVYSLALSPDGTCIAAGCEAEKIFQPESPYVDELDKLKNHERLLIKKKIYNIRVINMVPDHHDPYVIPRRSGIVRLKGEILSSPFEGHKDHVRSVAYSVDGKRIVSCSDDRTVRVWVVSSGWARTFKSHSNEIHSVAFFSPDGTQIVSDTGLFNLSTGSFTPHAFGNGGEAGFPFASSVDGRFLALRSHTPACQIWDTKSHQTIIQLSGHTDDVSSVAFFPDGEQMMSASKDGSIRVWNIELLEEREEMDGWRIDRGEGGHWILGAEKGHLFWTPLPIQHTRNTLVIGKCLKIDITNFVQGDEWWKCGEPLQRKEVPQGIEGIGDAVTKE